MPIYLPVAGMSVDVLVVSGVGLAIGFIAGMLGVGGGFLVTPLLVLLGIPIDVAVASGAAQAVATSISGTIAQWERGTVDQKMAALLLAGSFVGSLIGVQLLVALKATGQMDLVVSASYVLLLGVLGTLLLAEGARAIVRARTSVRIAVRRRRHTWVHGLPFQTRFRQSKLYMSMIPPVVLGLVVGVLGGVMGVGGGFFAVPFMVYVFAMPTRTVLGTSLLTVFATSVMTTLLQAWLNQAVDIVLAAILMSGGVLGVQLGLRAGSRLKSEELRAMLGLLVVATAIRMAFGLLVAPAEPYGLDPIQLPR